MGPIDNWMFIIQGGKQLDVISLACAFEMKTMMMMMMTTTTTTTTTTMMMMMMTMMMMMMMMMMISSDVRQDDTI